MSIKDRVIIPSEFLLATWEQQGEMLTFAISKAIEMNERRRKTGTAKVFLHKSGELLTRTGEDYVNICIGDEIEFRNECLGFTLNSNDIDRHMAICIYIHSEVTTEDEFLLDDVIDFFGPRKVIDTKKGDIVLVTKGRLSCPEFRLICNFNDRNIAKNAGFKFNGQYSYWYTTDINVALKLKEYANTKTLRKFQRLQMA
jgi:hypothetical protein